jgi:hypothetical protein
MAAGLLQINSGNPQAAQPRLAALRATHRKAGLDLDTRAHAFISAMVQTRNVPETLHREP